jgi:ABC-type multidrug transport system ATPase subunit
MANAEMTHDKTTKFIVETYDLTKIYGNAEEVRALDGVTMQVAEGEMVAVMGPSGSGKSTLLHMIGALDRPTSGQVIVAGQDLATVKSVWIVFATGRWALSSSCTTSSPR